MKTTATSNATLYPTAIRYTSTSTKKIPEGRPTLALLPNKSEEELNNNGETMGGNGNISVRRSNRTFTPPDRLGSVPYFWKCCLVLTRPTRKEPSKPKLMTREEMISDEDYDPNDDK